MKLYLKNGNICEVDTSYLFNNQYNTTDGKRFLDAQVARVEDDVRLGWGRCRYCGAMIRKGEEEAHWHTRESQGCESCWWYRERHIDTTKETSTTTNENGETIRTTIETHTYKKMCTYGDSHSGTSCTNSECRKRGVEWFTPENTFFLKYPNGFTPTPINRLACSGFTFDERRSFAPYFKKIGSYSLEALLETKVDGERAIWAFHIYNARKNIIFKYDNGILFNWCRSFGWRAENAFQGVPESVVEALKLICKI